jgi:hypothetical protein
MTVQLAAPPAKPLPVIVNPIVDELLSSWLKRTAHIYGASARDVLTHFGVKPPDSLRQMDFAQPLEVKTRLGWGLRTNTARIQRAGHPIPIRHANELVAIAVPLSRCPVCDRRWRAESATRPISRSWYEAWRVACGFCRRSFHLGSESRGQKKDVPLVPERLWQDAVKGSKLFERYLVGQPCGWLPPRLIWTLASAPIHRRDGFLVGFGLIVPEASHPAYGTLHQSFANTCRTENLFKRLALLAAVHRFNADPHGWLQAFSDSATERGRAAISTLLSELPSAIRHVMTEEACANTTPRRALLYACHSIERHQIRLRLAANLRQIDEFRLKLTSAASHKPSESRS